MTYRPAIAALKSGASMSPKNVWANEYAETGMVAYLIASVTTGKVKMLTSHGTLDEFEIGDTFRLVSDQSGRDLGRHIIVGIIDLTTNIKYIAKNSTWDAFTRSYPHYVVK